MNQVIDFRPAAIYYATYKVAKGLNFCRAARRALAKAAVIAARPDETPRAVASRVVRLDASATDSAA
jgi:hypothetical protein